jgi:hypothetical protein
MHNSQLPAGGATLSLWLGEPSVQATTSKSYVGWDKGPQYRSHLTVHVAASEQAIGHMESLPKHNPASATREIFLGLSATGERMHLRKRGSGNSGLYISD